MKEEEDEDDFEEDNSISTSFELDWEVYAHHNGLLFKLLIKNNALKNKKSTYDSTQTLN